MLTGCTPESQAGAASPTTGSTASPVAGGDDWDAVRAQFALDPDLMHFAAYVLASHPQPVRESIDRWREALDADTTEVLHDDMGLDDAVRTAAASYLRVAPGEIAITNSTTMGLGLIYHGFPLDQESHVLTTTHDFYSTHESLRLAAVRSGAEVEQIALYDDPAEASGDEMTARVAAAIRPETRIVALTWVHSSTGVKIPVRLIADVLAEANEGRSPEDRAVLCLDAIHGLGAEHDGPVELGCDAFISGTHKWLFGPRGTGIVWASQQAGEAVAPIIPAFQAPSFGNWITGGDAPSPFGLGATPGGYQAFEHRWAMVEAFEFHQSIGIDRVAARTRELATRLKDGLSAIAGVRLVTPQDPQISSGLVCCEVAGRDPAALVERLRLEHGIIANVTPYREQYVRFGTSIVTTPEQVDETIAAIESLAS